MDRIEESGVVREATSEKPSAELKAFNRFQAEFTQARRTSINVFVAELLAVTKGKPLDSNGKPFILHPGVLFVSSRPCFDNIPGNPVAQQGEADIHQHLGLPFPRGSREITLESITNLVAEIQKSNSELEMASNSGATVNTHPLKSLDPVLYTQLSDKQLADFAVTLCQSGKVKDLGSLRAQLGLVEATLAQRQRGEQPSESLKTIANDLITYPNQLKDVAQDLIVKHLGVDSGGARFVQAPVDPKAKKNLTAYVNQEYLTPAALAIALVKNGVPQKTEAHAAHHQMFGFPRLPDHEDVIERPLDGAQIDINGCLALFDQFDPACAAKIRDEQVLGTEALRKFLTPLLEEQEYVTAGEIRHRLDLGQISTDETFGAPVSAEEDIQIKGDRNLGMRTLLALGEVYDPDRPDLSLVQMRLIFGIEVKEESDKQSIKIDMSLTTDACGFKDKIIGRIQRKVEEKTGITPTVLTAPAVRWKARVGI